MESKVMRMDYLKILKEFFKNKDNIVMAFLFGSVAVFNIYRLRQERREINLYKIVAVS